MKESIAACISTPPDQRSLSFVKMSIAILKNYVDDIHIQSDGLEKHLIENIEKLGTVYHDYEWQEDFAKYKNKSISYTKSPWVLVLDHDEVPTEALASSLNYIIHSSNQGKNYQSVHFRESLCIEDNILPPEWKKPVLHLNTREPYKGKVHTGFKPNMFARTILHHAIYVHYKSSEEILIRGMRDTFLCLPPNELIVTQDDVKSIKNIRVGDNVIGNMNLSPVLKTFSREYNGKIVEIRPMGCLPIRTTPEHPILTADVSWKSINGKRKRIVGSTAWIPANKIIPNHLSSSTPKSMYVVFPKLRQNNNIKEIDLTRFYKMCGQKPKNRREYTIDEIAKSNRMFVEKIPINEETAELFGYYLAEGNGGNSMRLSFGSHEQNLVEKCVNISKKYLPYKTGITKGNGTLILDIGGTVIGRFVKHHFGNNALNKKIPGWILYNDKSILTSFLNAYLKGDGHHYNDRKSTSGKLYLENDAYTTSSRRLALQLQLAFSRFDIFTGIEHDKREGNYNFQGRIVNQHDRYIIRVINRKKNRKFIEDNNNFYLPIQTTTKSEYNGMVYNLHTECNTFTVSNIMTHNCGGGNELNNKSGLWKPLREWCVNKGINSWRDFKLYFYNGNVDPWLKEWMEKAYALSWHTDIEYKSFKILYYRIFPDEVNKQ